MELTLDALAALPDRAEYRAESGRASASVRSEGGVIVVQATCDSLQRRCELYEQEAAAYKTALEQRSNDVQVTAERQGMNWFQQTLMYTGVAAILYVILKVLIKRFINTLKL